MHGDVCVFSGSAHPELAQEICNLLGIPLSPSRTSRYQNDNLYVQLEETVRERDVFIIQPFYPPPVSDRVLELLMMLDAARSASACRVTAAIPYYSYSRSDKKDEPRISVAGKLFADLLVAAGAQRILTMALHTPQVQSFFNVPVDHLSSLSALVNHFAGTDLSESMVVSPDIGHAKRAAEFARSLNLPIAVASKKRIDDHTVLVDGLIGSVHGHKAIILDDEIAAGNSAIQVIQFLRSEGVREFTLACTHGILCGDAVPRLNAIPEITSIVTTNTVPVPVDKRIKDMQVLSVASLFADAIRRTQKGETLQLLFEYS